MKRDWPFHRGARRDLPAAREGRACRARSRASSSASSSWSRPITPRCRARPEAASRGGRHTSSRRRTGLNEIVIAEEVGSRADGRLLRQFRRRLARARPHPLRKSRRQWPSARSTAKATDAVRDYHRLLSIFEPKAVLTDNIWGYLWGKLGLRRAAVRDRADQRLDVGQSCLRAPLPGLSPPRAGGDGGGEGARREAARLQRLRPGAFMPGAR